MPALRSAKPLSAISRELSDAVARLRFSKPVAYVYNPLEYARGPHERYLERWGSGKKAVLFLGMNPGPFGMAQTGVPFGDVALVRDWLRVSGDVGKPASEHPERPISGFACSRGEVSGQRLWGFARSSFGTPERFFERFFVVNYCPLAFVEASGKNRTPDKLPRAEQAALFAACDRALVQIAETLAPAHVVGVGAFATERARRALAGLPLAVSSVLHPSPASPRANRGWERFALEELRANGIDWPDPSPTPRP